MTIKTRKIGIIGAGNVGPHVGLLLAVQGLADEIVLYDIKEEKAAAEASTHVLKLCWKAF